MLDKRLVARTMRRIHKLQVSDSTMNPDVVRFIFADRLMCRTEWPGWLIRFTERGTTFLRETEDENSHAES